MPFEPTYYATTADQGMLVYHCCYCEAAGTEHIATDLDLFTMHQQQRHDGRMVEKAEASAVTAQEAPPQGRAARRQAAQAEGNEPVPGTGV